MEVRYLTCQIAQSGVASTRTQRTTNAVAVGSVQRVALHTYGLGVSVSGSGVIGLRLMVCGDSRYSARNEVMDDVGRV